MNKMNLTILVLIVASVLIFASLETYRFYNPDEIELSNKTDTGKNITGQVFEGAPIVKVIQLFQI